MVKEIIVAGFQIISTLKLYHSTSICSKK